MHYDGPELVLHACVLVRHLDLTGHVDQVIKLDLLVRVGVGEAQQLGHQNLDGAHVGAD